MIPIILVNTDKKLLTTYINSLIKDQASIIINIEPEKTEFSINQIKSLISETKIYQPIRRIYLLNGFDHSSLVAQNDFLKALEQPPANIQFILVVSRIYQLLPTIISRSKIIKLMNKNDAKENKKPLINFLKIKGLLPGTTKESALEIIDQMIDFFRQRLSSDKNAPLVLKEILKIRKLLENNNLNPQLSIDHLLIFIRKQYNDYNGYKDYNDYKS